MKDIVIDFIQGFIPSSFSAAALVGAPKTPEHGDFALPCFAFAKEMKQAPQQIAQDIAENMNKSLPPAVNKAVAMGPYVNLFLNKTFEAEDFFTNIDAYLSYTVPEDERESVLIEWPSPNSNKPLHLGHLRNMLTGLSLSQLLEKVGHKVIRVNLNNDRGIAITKSMLMYTLYGEGKTPESEGMKPDVFVGNFYSMFEHKAQEDETLQQRAQDMLQRWEAGDKEIRKLWKQMNEWAFAGHHVTYERMHILHDKEYFESNIFEHGKELVKTKHTEGLFTTDDQGNIVCDLTAEGYDQKVLLRSDGTSIYITQDIALAFEKVKDFGDCDKYVFVVGNEQAYHFEVLFEILKKLGLGDTDKFYHYAYGMFTLPEGKMSSRKGNVILCDELLDDVQHAAAVVIKEKELTKDLDDEEVQRRAAIIGSAALNFFVLKYNPKNNVVFTQEDAMSFEGDTGPYLLYTYARIQSLLAKAKEHRIVVEDDDELDLKTQLSQAHYELFADKEMAVVKKLKEYNDVLARAATEYKMSLVATYCIELAQTFNDFYHSCQILKEETTLAFARLALSQVVASVLHDGLSVLAIDVLDQM